MTCLVHKPSRLRKGWGDTCVRCGVPIQLAMCKRCGGWNECEHDPCGACDSTGTVWLGVKAIVPTPGNRSEGQP